MQLPLAFVPQLHLPEQRAIRENAPTWEKKGRCARDNLHSEHEYHLDQRVEGTRLRAKAGINPGPWTFESRCQSASFSHDKQRTSPAALVRVAGLQSSDRDWHTHAAGTRVSTRVVRPAALLDRKK